jgi:hypothetical protein
VDMHDEDMTSFRDVNLRGTSSADFSYGPCAGQVADQRGADLLVLSADAVHDKSVDANLLAVSLTHCKVHFGRLRHKSVCAEALTKGATIVVAAVAQAETD